MRKAAGDENFENTPRTYFQKKIIETLQWLSNIVKVTVSPIRSDNRVRGVPVDIHKG